MTLEKDVRNTGTDVVEYPDDEIPFKKSVPCQYGCYPGCAPGCVNGNQLPVPISTPPSNVATDINPLLERIIEALKGLTKIIESKK